MIHVKGMWMVVAARGGISTLEANKELMLMISWYGSLTLMQVLGLFFNIH